MKDIHQIDSEISGYYESIMKYASNKISDQCDRLSASTTDQELLDFLDKISNIDWLEFSFKFVLVAKMKEIVMNKLKRDDEIFILNWRKLEDVKNFIEKFEHS